MTSDLCLLPSVGVHGPHQSVGREGEHMGARDPGAQAVLGRAGVAAVRLGAESGAGGT